LPELPICLVKTLEISVSAGLAILIFAGLFTAPLA